MPDNTLQFETRVNLSGLQTGMAQATNTVQQDAQKMAAAMSTLKNETAALGEAYKVFGNMAAAGNQAAIGAIAQHIQATDAAKASVAALSVVEERETEVVEEQTQSLQRNITARMAASSEIRVLEGNLMGSTRAASAFLSTLPGIGVAMQAAFPIFGAIALGEIFVQLASKAMTLYEDFFTLKEESADLAKGMAEDGELIAKTWGNTLSVLHTTGMRDNPIGTLKGDAIDATFAVQGLEGQLSNLNKDLRDAQALRVSGNYYGQGTTEEGNNNRILGDQQKMRALQEQITNLNTQIADKQSQIAKKEDGPKGPDPQIQQLRDLEEGLNKAKLAMDVSAQAEADYWSSSLTLFRDGSSQYETILGKIVSANHRVAEEFGKDVLKEVEDNQRAIDASAKMSEEITSNYEKMIKAEQESAKTQAELDQAATRLSQTETEQASTLALAVVAQEQAYGGITKLTAAQRVGAIQAQTYAQRIAELKKELADLANNPSLSDADKEKRGFGIESQITQVSGQANVAGLQNAQAQAQAFASPFLTAFNDINQGFLGVTNKMILGTQSISRDFANMGAQLVVSVADSFEKMLAKSAQFEIQTLLAHQLANTQKIASDTTTAAVTTGISATSALTQIAHEAAVAAASTWAALSGIPIIGPVLGAAAAGAAYAGVLALAAFETGGIIPNTGIAMVHQGESVLPKSLTNLLLNTANSSSSSQSSSVNQTNNYNGMSDAGFKRMMSRNSEHAVATVQRGLRRQGRV